MRLRDRNAGTKQYELIQSLDDTWMIFERDEAVPCVLGRSALIGLDRTEAEALLRSLGVHDSTAKRAGRRLH